MGPGFHVLCSFSLLFFFLLRRGSKIFLRFSSGSMSTLPAPRQTQLTSKKQKRMLVGSCQPGSSAILHLSPHAGGVDFHRPRPPHSFPFCHTPHTPTFTQPTRTHLPTQTPHVHSPPTCLPTHTCRTHTLQFSKHTPPKLPHAASLRVPPHTGAFHSCAPQNLRLHMHRLGASPSPFGRAWGDWRPRPSPIASRDVRSLPGALSSPGLSTWRPVPLGRGICSRPRKHQAGCGTSQAPPPRAFGPWKAAAQSEEPPQFPVLPNGVGGRELLGAAGRCPSPLRKCSPSSQSQFALLLLPARGKGQGLWVGERK